MTDEQIAKVDGGVRLIPATAGVVALAYNLPGLTARSSCRATSTAGDLRRRDHRAGTIPRIAAANPG